MSPIAFTPGIPAQATPSLSGTIAQPAEASDLPALMLEGKPAALSVPALMPEGESAPSSLQDSADEIPAESDPQQLLALLLATPITPPPAEGSLSAGAAALPPSAQAAAAGLLRTHVQGAGAAAIQVMAPLTPVKGSAADHDIVPPTLTEKRQEMAPAEIAPQSVPTKLVTPVDALLASQSVQRQLQNAGDAFLAENVLQHPLPAMFNTLLKGESMAVTLPGIRLPATPGQQAEALHKALAERLEMQIDSRIQKATIRLDPPNLGKMSISIQVESGKLQVHIQAVQPEVTRLLQQVSHEMRASLSEQHNVQVNVQVSTQSGDSRQQSRHPTQPETAILNNNEEVTAQARGTDGTILTMV